jgi:hypothetical protein
MHLPLIYAASVLLDLTLRVVSWQRSVGHLATRRGLHYGPLLHRFPVYLQGRVVRCGPNLGAASLYVASLLLWMTFDPPRHL